MDETLLVLRIVAGLLFAGHGAQKLFGWFGGHGLEGTAGFFEQIGLKPGALHARAAGFNEFAGGLLLALGFLAPLAAALIIATMVAAVITVHGKNGPWVTENGYELNVLYGLIAFGIAGIGAGSASLDSAFGLDLNGIGWAIAALVAGLAGGVGAVLVGRAGSGPSEDAHASAT